MSQTITDELLQTLILAVEDEARETKGLSTSFALGKGVKIPTASQRPLYSFSVSNAPRLQEEARGRLLVNGTSVECTVTSRRSDGLDVSTFVDLGDELDSATLTVDRSELLLILAARLESVKGDPPFHFNKQLAAQVLEPSSSPREVDDSFVTAPDDLTKDQQEAFKRAIQNRVTYLWGPPGTGKTITLSAIAFNLFCHNSRVLLVSHTNRAVDGVVFGLCKRIVGKSRASIPEGSVARVGAISRKGLGVSFGSQVGLEHLTEQHQKKVRERIAAVRKERELNATELESLRRQYGLTARRKVLEDELASLQKMLSDARGSESRLATVMRVLRVRYGAKGPAANSVDEIKRSMKALTSEILEVTTELESAASPDEIHDSIADGERRDQDLVESIADLERLVEDPSAAVIQRARVVACTATQAVLRCASLGEFDAVIIDEASMLPLPYVVFLAGLAKGRVVIGGDFRQLPPISLSTSPSARQWFARDIFEVAGIVDLADRGEESPFFASLTTQFRGHEALSSLINNRFYGGRLVPKHQSPPTREVSDGLVPPWLGQNSIVLVDTSSLGARGHTENGSKVNLTHAIVVRNICLGLRSVGLMTGVGDVGVIAPYRPQVSLVEDLLDEAGMDDVAVGTAHRFQGAERDTMLLDLTESSPHKIGAFLGATSIRETGAKLLNVSLSRANQRLVIVANLRHLEQLSEQHVLRGVLDDIKNVGTVVDARDIVPDAVGVGVEARVDASLSQRFDGETFLAGLSADIHESRSSILIGSSRMSSRAAHIISAIVRPAIERGVVVEVSLVSDVGDGSQDERREALSALEGAGVTVHLTDGPVYDGVVLDDEVVWLGNTPPLDCVDQEGLLMTRVVSSASARVLRRLILAEVRAVAPSPMAANA